MSALIRYILCISILTTSYSLKPAYKAAKFTATGVGIAATLYSVDLLRNYTQYPHPALAKAATHKDIDDLTRPPKKAASTFYRELTKSKIFQEFQIEREAVTKPVSQFLDQHATPAYKAASEKLDAGSNYALEAIQPLATTLHLKLYPKKEDCPCINDFDACPAHKVDFGEALLIKAEKLIKPTLK